MIFPFIEMLNLSSRKIFLYLFLYMMTTHFLNLIQLSSTDVLQISEFNYFCYIKNEMKDFHQ